MLPCKPNSRCDLRETKLAPDTRWGSRSRDPIGYLGKNTNLFELAISNTLNSVDPNGLFAEPPVIVQPGWVNCAGFALGNGVSIQPANTVFNMGAGMGFDCFKGVAAADCKAKCGDKQCAMGYLYIDKRFSEKHGRDIFRLLEWLCEQKRMRGERCDGLDDMLDVNFFELLRWLHQQLGVPLEPMGPSLIDFHFLKCAGKEYKFQGCLAENKSKDDKCDDPFIWTPSNQKPDFFGKDRLISKMCCCKSNHGRRPILPPRQ